MSSIVPVSAGLRVGATLLLLTCLAASSPKGARREAAAEQQERDSVKLLLTEVRFDPKAADAAFVELLNAGSAKVDIVRFLLRVNGKDTPMPRLADSLAAGARLLVRFGAPLNSGAVEIALSDSLAADSGSIELLRYDRLRLDRVAWGSSSGAVSPGEGGFVRSAVGKGSSIGRPPGADAPGDVTQWVVYPPAQVTPGTANSLPAVAQLLPLDGVVIEEPTVDLAWYPVPGAARYRVQVAADTTFARLALDQTVELPEIAGTKLVIGKYAWRVQAIDNSGKAAAWSDISMLEVAPPMEAPDTATTTHGPYAETKASDVAVGRMLNVTYLTQHKDTRMLLLESPREKGKHAWDADHGNFMPLDKADTHNCAVANAAMINRFFNGDLSQDRIGYEVLSRNGAKYVAAVSGAQCIHCTNLPDTLTVGDLLNVAAELREREPGPEQDLVWGKGLNIAQTVAALTFAVGAPPIFTSEYLTKDEFWRDVTAELNAGRPLVGANRHHAFVIRGYQTNGGQRYIYINDPANGQRMIDIDAASLPAAKLSTFRFPSRPKVARQEASVTTDADGDGVVDFDELERFKTRPGDPDSDADGVKDKQDIIAGVFELEFQLGYAFSGSTVGRDFDNDSLPTELDPDSDWPRFGNARGVNDGCIDGEEDMNGDGHRTGHETSNFNPSDDVCARLGGVLTFEVSMQNPTEASLTKNVEARVVVHVKLKPERGDDPARYVDDGSTFSATSSSYNEIETDDPTCRIYWEHWFSGAGPFSGPDEYVTGYRGDDGTLSVDISAERKTQVFVNLCGRGGPGDYNFHVTIPQCDGRLNTTQQGQRTYFFACNTKPNMGLGWTVSRFGLNGWVRVR